MQRRRWLDQFKTIDPGLRLRRRESRQILRIREESEDLQDGEGNPVGELKAGAA
jgi:hypothetical protein